MFLGQISLIIEYINSIYKGQYSMVLFDWTFYADLLFVGEQTETSCIRVLN